MTNQILWSQFGKDWETEDLVNQANELKAQHKVQI